MKAVIPTSIDGIPITDYPEGTYVSITKNYVGMKYQVIRILEISTGQCTSQAVGLFAEMDDAEDFAKIKNNPEIFEEAFRGV